MLFGAWFGFCCWFRACNRLISAWSRLGFCVGVWLVSRFGTVPRYGWDGPVYGGSPDWDGPNRRAVR
jgi:hypothetical protein